MRTILQVEDDPNDVFLMRHAMKKVGVLNPVHVASDGQQAIDYWHGIGKFANREKYPLPCLVLLDLKLPYVMGLEVLKRIRGQPGPAVPVIMMTASGQESDIVTAYQLGANAFLTKPSEAHKLEEMVKAIKDFWLTHNMLPQETAPESPTEGVACLSQSFATGFKGTPQSAANRNGLEALPRNMGASI
jgi:CheY-like chemotaxis protein